MAREEAHYNEPTPKHSRSHRRHQHKHGHESRRHNDEDRGSSSDFKDRSSEHMVQEPVPRVFTWSEPVLDTDSSGRFQYQARLTQDGYQWTISGSEAGTNPQYLSPTPTSNMAYPLHTTVTTYPVSSYVHQPIQNELPYYDYSNVSASPVVPLNDGGNGNYSSEEYNERETSCDERSTLRRNKSSDGHRKEKSGKQRRHRSRSRHRHHSSHHCRCHHRSKSRDANNRQRHTDRGHSYASSHEKVSDWLHSRRYAD